jgi:NAD(P)-dependent dehydrogenase (short-subunit alcohol dehydrogenase family)
MAEQKTLVLTGASRGIGHATVKRFSAEGWRVLTCSRQPFDSRCPWPGGEDNHIQIDLADPNKTIAAIEVIKGKIDGRLHALVNNAGISPKGEGGKRLYSMSTSSPASCWRGG